LGSRHRLGSRQHSVGYATKQERANDRRRHGLAHICSTEGTQSNKTRRRITINQSIKDRCRACRQRF
jgi:hypothetical protein